MQPVRGFAKQYTGSEPGDPVKAAGVLFEVSRVKEPPIRLVRGRFASKYVKEGYDESLAELERWSDLSLSTDYDDARGRRSLEKMLTADTQNGVSKASTFA